MFSRRIFSLACILCILSSLLISTPIPTGAAVSPHAWSTAPESSGVDPGWLAKARQEIERQEYFVTWQEATYLPGSAPAYQAPNRAQNLRTYFLPVGLVLIPRTFPPGMDAPPWRFEWGLKAVGDDKQTQPLQPADNPLPQASLAAIEERLEAARPGLAEVFGNQPEGLAQAITLDGPAGAPGEAVLIEFGYSSGWSTSLGDDGRSVDFSPAGGRAALARRQLPGAGWFGRPARFAARSGSRQPAGLDRRTGGFPCQP